MIMPYKDFDMGFLNNKKKENVLKTSSERADDLLKAGKFKIGSVEEVYWTDIRDKTAIEITTLRKMLKFNEAISELAIGKIKVEQAKSVNKS